MQYIYMSFLFMVNIQFSVKDVELFSLFSGFTYLFISVLLLWVALTK